ncbi:MAG: LysM peptidoglycan-binding domain-containing protein [Cytophagales bacterium]|nr:LysM peptidoglycan-binding domain-containing protein [Cytophagales bacterium]
MPVVGYGVMRNLLLSFCVFWFGMSSTLWGTTSGSPPVRSYSDAEILERLEAIENLIPLSFNPRVRAFIDFYTVRAPSYLPKVQVLETFYFPLFEELLAKYELPDELKYLAVIESGLRSGAISRTGAVGLWQFMPSTGRLMGLRQTYYVDERRDLYKSTDAACRHLKDLYQEFQSWHLALAAYNSGSGRVRRAIRRGRSKDFWRIYRHLPRETRAYVPQFIAVAYAMEYHVWHNLYPSRRLYELSYDTIYTSNPVDLATLGKSLSLCSETFRLLNAQYVHGVTPSSERSLLRIPVDKREFFQSHKDSLLTLSTQVGRERLLVLQKAQKKFLRYGRKKIVYRVRKGDVLGSIARRYRVRQSDICRWNRLRNRHAIRAGRRLVLWVRPHVHARYYGYASSFSRKHRPSKKPKGFKKGSYYRVQPGDSLWEISNRYAHLSVKRIKKLNHLRSSWIYPGQYLLIE